MKEIKYGKIESVRFGLGGYQDVQIGLWLTLSGQGWGVGASINGGWSLGIDSKGAQWTEADRDAQFAKMAREINELLVKAKVSDIAALKNKPVVITFNGGTELNEWRIFEEVL